MSLSRLYTFKLQSSGTETPCGLADANICHGRFIVSIFIYLKADITHSSEILVIIYQNVWWHNPYCHIQRYFICRVNTNPKGK
jgi:hypothetical protein